MIDLKISESDLVIEDHDLALTSGLDQVRQRCETRLRTFLGEWFADTSLGVPYFEDVLKKNPDMVAVNSMFQDQILKDSEITKITKFQSVYDNAERRLTLSFTAATASGSFSVSEGLSV